jgi:hypothetical protein
MKKDSLLRGPETQGHHTRRPGSKRNLALRKPVRRSQPLLMKHWKYLWRAEFIEFRRDGQLKGTGWVDDLTPDGTTAWICLTGGLGRMMIHRDDGFDI